MNQPMHPQGNPQQVPQGMTEEQAINAAYRDSLEDTISILEGVGPLCNDIDQLIDMLTLAMRNDSQLALIRAHMSPKRMKK